jgi:hypothetical protein
MSPGLMTPIFSIFILLPLECAANVCALPLILPYAGGAECGDTA